MITDPEALRGNAAAARTHNLVFVPGLFGSELQGPGGQRIFGDDAKRYIPSMLADPAAAALAVTSTAFAPVALAGSALRFVDELVALPVRSVTPYLYDWRHGVEAASPGLDGILSSVDGRISIVAYSLGGLVTLHALASGAIRARNLGRIDRVVLIASPYYGSTLALLALAGSPDFVKYARGFFAPNAAKWIVFIADRLGARLFEAFAPIVAQLQTTYDLIPHDDETLNQLKMLKKPRSRSLYTSESWPLWDVLVDGEGRRVKARAVQKLIRETPLTVEVVSVFSSAVETPHYCQVEAQPPFHLKQAQYEWGDGIVADCCVYKPGMSLERELTWVELERGPLGHSDLLRHPATHEILVDIVR